MAPRIGVKLTQFERSSRMRKRMEFAFRKQFPRCEVKVLSERGMPAMAYLQIDYVVRFIFIGSMETKIYSLDNDNNPTFQFSNVPKDGVGDRRMKSHDRMWRLFMASEIGQEKIKKWNALPTQKRVPIPTGLPALDKALENGLGSGAMTTFAAVRPIETPPPAYVSISSALVERISKAHGVQGMSLTEAVDKLLVLQLDSLDEQHSDEAWVKRCLSNVEKIPVGGIFSVLHTMVECGEFNGIRLRKLVKALRESNIVKVLEGDFPKVSISTRGKMITAQFERIEAPQ